METDVIHSKSRDTRMHFPLTEKQQEFFRKRRVAFQQLELEMRGALQLIVEENELTGKVTMADDFTELIIDTGANGQ